MDVMMFASSADGYKPGEIHRRFYWWFHNSKGAKLPLYLKSLRSTTSMFALARCYNVLNRTYVKKLHFTRLKILQMILVLTILYRQRKVFTDNLLAKSDITLVK